MKRIAILFLIILVGFGCGKNSNKPISQQNTPKANINNNTTYGSNNDSGNVTISYVYKDGVIIDTIYYYSSNQKAIIRNSMIIDNKIYIAYSKYTLQRNSKHDTTFAYDGHYINSLDLSNLPARPGELFDCNKLKSKDTPFEVGESCSPDDDLEFTRFMKMPDSDSKIYIYAIKHECSDYRTHIVIEKVNNHFEKLFELESSDTLLNFQLKNDSILTCNYNYWIDGKGKSYKFKYNCTKKIEIK